MIYFHDMAEGLLVGRVLGISASRYLFDPLTIASVAGAVAGVASAGFSIYQGVTGSKKSPLEGYVPPETSTEKTEEQLRAEKLRRARLGRKQTWLTGSQETLGAPSLARPALKSTLGG